MPYRPRTLGLFIGVVVIWLLTGGLAVGRSYKFDIQEQTIGERVNVGAWFLPHRTEFNLPWILWYRTESAPFTLRLQPRSGYHINLHVVEALIRSSDGAQTRYAIAQSSVPFGIPHADAILRPTIRRVCERAGDCYLDVEGLVPTIAPTTITLNGWFLDEKDDRTEFSMRVVFNPQFHFAMGPAIWALMNT